MLELFGGTICLIDILNLTANFQPDTNLRYFQSILEENEWLLRLIVFMLPLYVNI